MTLARTAIVLIQVTRRIVVKEKGLLIVLPATTLKPERSK
jgi:hypothetical protein